MHRHVDDAGPTSRRDADTDFWDRYWSAGTEPTVAESTLSRVLDEMKLDHLLRLAPDGGLSLEVGCGSARLSCLLAGRGFRTVGVDTSRAALQGARQNYRHTGLPGSFVLGSGFALPFSHGSFDLVMSTGLLEHYDDPSALVEEMVRVLRPGGLFYSDIVPRGFSLFRSLQWVGLLRDRLWGRSRDAFFERSFRRAEIVDLLRNAGLQQPRVFPAGVVPPYLPLLTRSRRLRAAQVRLVELTRGFWQRLDGTAVAGRLGFYYFAWARKRARG